VTTLDAVSAPRAKVSAVDGFGGTLAKRARVESKFLSIVPFFVVFEDFSIGFGYHRVIVDIVVK
jgi:hypothetical protein